MSDTRCRNYNWTVRTKDHVGSGASFEGAQLAVLMDIRDELQALNRLLNCQNFLGMPRTLKRIDKRLGTKLKLK